MNADDLYPPRPRCLVHAEAPVAELDVPGWYACTVCGSQFAWHDDEGPCDD